MRPNPLEQLAGGNYPGPRDFLEDFLEGEGAPTSSLLLRWNLKSNPESLNLNPGDSENSGNFQIRVIPKIPRILNKKLENSRNFPDPPARPSQAAKLTGRRGKATDKAATEGK